MPNLIAIEWDSAEARVVAGRTRGREFVVEQAFDIPLSPEVGVTVEEGEIGPLLAAALAKRGLSRCDALVGVGRASIELRKLQLPPAPEEELPDLVRFQAMRQFTTIGEEWPLDFVTLSRSETATEVLAAAIAPQLVEQIRGCMSACALHPRRLILRPYAAASLLLQSRPGDDRVRLVVEILSSDVDLFVLADGKVALMRTVRLAHGGGGASGQAAALLGEIRRTVAAAQNQLSGRKIDAIVMFGDEAGHDEVRKLAANQLSLPVESFQPFAAALLSQELAAALPAQPGRFAPLLGMLLDEANEARHAIDFLHPRKRPEAKNQRERYLLYATAGVAAVCLALALGKWQLNRQDARINALSAELQSAQPAVTTAKKRAAELKAIEQFQEQSIPWLDELERLSARLPPTDDAILTQFVGTTQNDGSGRIALDGMVRSPGNVEELAKGLRDETHRVVGRGASQDAGRNDYQWRFNQGIVITPKTNAPKANAPKAGATTPGQPPPADKPGAEKKTLTAEVPNGRQS